MLDLITLVSAVGLQQAGKGLGEVSRDDQFQDDFAFKIRNFGLMRPPPSSIFG